MNTISLIFWAVPLKAWEAPQTKSIVLWDCSLSNKSKWRITVFLSINFLTIWADSENERGSITVTSLDLYEFGWETTFDSLSKNVQVLN